MASFGDHNAEIHAYVPTFVSLDWHIINPFSCLLAGGNKSTTTPLIGIINNKKQ